MAANIVTFSGDIGPLKSYNYSPVYKLDFGELAPLQPPSEGLAPTVAVEGILKVRAFF